MGPAAVPASVVRAVRDAGSARQSGPLRICILVLGCRRSSISTHVSSVSHVSRGTHQSVTSVKAVVARGAVAACNGAATRSGRPRHTDTPRTMGGYRARSGIAPQTSRRTDGGEAESHTHRSSTDTLHVSARSMWPALSPLLSPFQRRRAATRRAEPVSAGDLGAARDAGMRDGSVGSVPKADRLGCELRQPPFLYPLDHVQAVGGRAGWPRAGGGEGVRR